jgi:hypothetical protein
VLSAVKRVRVAGAIRRVALAAGSGIQVVEADEEPFEIYD